MFDKLKALLPSILLIKIPRLKTVEEIVHSDGSRTLRLRQNPYLKGRVFIKRNPLGVEPTESVTDIQIIARKWKSKEIGFHRIETPHEDPTHYQNQEHMTFYPHKNSGVYLPIDKNFHPETLFQLDRMNAKELRAYAQDIKTRGMRRRTKSRD